MRILLIGLGKSGTTALFYKLKSALPPETRWLFEPIRFDAVAMPEPHLLVKTLINKQGLEIESFQTFDKKVFLVRDPRDLIISRILYHIYNAPGLCRDGAKVSTFLAMLRRKEADPKSTSLCSIIDLFTQLAEVDLSGLLIQSLDLALRFHDEHPCYFVYKYEHMVAARYEALADYLDLDLNPEASQVPEFLERVVRTKQSGDWRNWFTAEDVDFFSPHCGAFMQRFDYGNDWMLPAEPRIPPSHASQYVRRIVDERRALPT
jgi:hypothetical protein